MEALVVRGVPSDRLYAQGYGMSVPLVPHDTEENLATNRRIEVHVRRLVGEP